MSELFCIRTRIQTINETSRYMLPCKTQFILLTSTSESTVVQASLRKQPPFRAPAPCCVRRGETLPLPSEFQANFQVISVARRGKLLGANLIQTSRLTCAKVNAILWLFRHSLIIRTSYHTLQKLRICGLAQLNLTSSKFKSAVNLQWRQSLA